MPAIDFDTERTYDETRFSAQEAFRTDQSKIICGYFEPGQFIPVHAPMSDVIVSVRQGTGIIREGDIVHQVEPGDVVAIEAGTERSIRADENQRFEALLVTAPPPTDAEHEPVRRGIKKDEFEPVTHT